MSGRDSGGVGWNTSVEPARLTKAVRMSDCLIMTTTLPFADMSPCGTDHSEVRACTEPGSKRVGLCPKGRPARNQDTFPTSSDTERAKTGAKRGRSAAPVMEAMTVTERLRAGNSDSTK